MTTTPGEQVDTIGADEETVLAYLRAHPDLLARHPDVLADLDIPHRPGGGAVSLIERQVRQLRQRNVELERRLADLMRTARDNERVGQRLLDLGRGLLEADSLDALLATVRDALLRDSGADQVAIRLLATSAADPPSHPPERYMTEQGDGAAFADLWAQGQPVCGVATQRQLAAMFGGRAEEIGSAALVPLRSGQPLGVLALASRDPDHFAAEMGTMFLDQLGELVASGLARHLEAE